MAVNIAAIKYIPDLPAVSALAGADLLHVSQGNTDKQATMTQLARFINDAAHPIGQLMFFGVKGKDPNTLFPGQSWTRYNAGRSLRVCLDNESNLGQNVGADQISLNTSQMPSHSHGAQGLVIQDNGNHQHNATTSWVGDHAHSAWTDAQGSHQHIVGLRSPNNHDGAGSIFGTSGGGGYNGAAAYGKGNNGIDLYPLTNVAGNHGHNVGIGGAGGHNHTLTTEWAGQHSHGIIGQVLANGSGAAITIVPNTVHVACWIRNS
ncbi:putative tail fiber protein [Pantoea phage vB_PagM_LIET2]|uniref:Putative tail fiber protein n=1 Tax=Pantoea phage vB_PagM_LIET2 TaxID=2508071 RepID=A0A411AWA8_9CAUD|nr:putative tail fiber protein [Pantoea phage vB_PagM_LIET2]QAX92350.1 putative tail fiber protein [Pantoea phage vB_PagM_LIET2]